MHILPRTLAATAALLAGAALHAAPAAAQAAKYCSGSLAANSFYSNVVQSPQGGADVEYHGQFQNRDTSRRKIVVTLIEVARIGPFTFAKKTQRFELDSFQQKDIALVATHTSNQGGSGAPTPAQVSQNLRASCTFGAATS